jgi:hypothetical protein
VDIKKQQSDELHEELPAIINQLEQLSTAQFSFAPHIQLFDGQSGIESLYEDILKTTIAEKR